VLAARLVRGQARQKKHWQFGTVYQQRLLAVAPLHFWILLIDFFLSLARSCQAGARERAQTDCL